jgi:phage shock protein E
MRIAFLAAVLLALVGCSGSDEPTTRVDLVGPQEFAARMDEAEAVVVNVHIPYEGELPGTDLFVPFDEVASSDELPDDRDQPLVVYCRSGNMSAEATAELVELGYTDVTDLEGGMVAWEAAGRSIEMDPTRRN